MKYIGTERIVLRNIQEKDLNNIYDYRNNEICSKYQRGQTNSREGIINLINKHKNDKICINENFIIAIELKETNEMIGDIIVMLVEMTFCLGYTLSYKYHRKGFAHEALSKIINILHKQYPDYEFISFTDKENIASKKLLEKLGHKYYGYSDGKKSDVYGKYIKVNPFNL